MKPQNYHKLGTLVGFDNKLWYVTGVNLRWLYNGYDYEYYLSEDMENSNGYDHIKTAGKWIPSVKLQDVEKVKSAVKAKKIAEIENLKKELKKLESALDNPD